MRDGCTHDTDVHRTTVPSCRCCSSIRLRGDKPASALSPECRSLQRNSNVHGQNQDSDISTRTNLSPTLPSSPWNCFDFYSYSRPDLLTANCASDRVSWFLVLKPVN
ncbi:hypothetical protein C1H46_045296 [Malus baccata]|uniref:Uncharacterized protein n=1 Tax=Malus baccata TaxID=106549 RepID=A0A540K4L4_MALBA|nr:hypothetical protein C1H46_045296 [Malus baccata]